MKNKKQIFYIIPTLEGGGAERVALQLSSALQHNYSDELSVTLVTLSGRGELQNNIPVNIEHIDLGARRSRRALIALVRLCRSKRPDIVITSLQVNSVMYFVRLFLDKKPHWFCRLENPLEVTLRRLSLFVRYSFIAALRQCDTIVTLTPNMQKEVKASIPSSADKVVTIPNPVDSKEILEKSTECTPHVFRPNIVMCGRLTEQKNFSQAIDIMSSLITLVPNIHLYILGDGPLLGHLQEETKEKSLEGAITFLGFKENPYPYLESADIFLLTSKWEGFGLVILEAMICKTVVVSTNTNDGPREILGESAFGVIVSSTNPAEIALEIESLLRNHQRRQLYIERGYNRALAYDITHIVQQYYKILTQRKVGV